MPVALQCALPGPQPPSPHASVTLEADMYKLHPCLSWAFSDFSSAGPRQTSSRREGPGDYFPSATSLPGLGLAMAVLPTEASSLYSQRDPTGVWELFHSSPSLDLGVVAALLANPRELHYPSHTFVYSVFIPFSSIPLLECPLFPARTLMG